MIDTNALRKLCKSATPGPWWAEVDKVKCRIRCYDSDEPTQITLWKPPAVGFAISDEQNEATASFIAQLNPENILVLLDEIDRLRKVESATRQGEKIGCRCTYADNQTVDTECLYHRAIRSERDRLQAEVTRLRELSDEMFATIVAALSLAPQDCGAYGVLDDAIKSLQPNWIRRTEEECDGTRCAAGAGAAGAAGAGPGGGD